MSGASEKREVISSSHSKRSCELCTGEGSNAEQGTPALINQLYVSDTVASLAIELELEVDSDDDTDTTFEIV